MVSSPHGGNNVGIFGVIRDLVNETLNRGEFNLFYVWSNSSQMLWIRD